MPAPHTHDGTCAAEYAANSTGGRQKKFAHTYVMYIWQFSLIYVSPFIPLFIRSLT